MKLCLRCNQYFEDVAVQCPADNTALELVGDNPLIGALINDRYVVDSVIGKGSSGIVYKATRLLMQREVAVKVLHSYLGAESGSLDRFLREAKAASQLKHPHIINIWESGVTDDGQPYFVMDYLEGSTLADLVKDKGALPLQRTLPIVRQICEALGEAHRHSIVHRDVKPENIVLQESDYANGEDFVKVLDFGIADQATGDQPGSVRQRTAAGSPAYMSPEQCQGFPLDLRSDIYSLAIVVFELLTGARPFEAEDIMTLFRLHVKQPPPSLSQIRPDLTYPAKLELAINKALSKDPNARQQDVLAFCKDVEEAVEGFLLETLNNDYNTPGSERSAKAINTLVLNAALEEVAPLSEKLHDYADDEARDFGNSWNMPSVERREESYGNNGGAIPPAVPGISDPFTTPAPSAGFSIPARPQSPAVRQPDALIAQDQSFEEGFGESLLPPDADSFASPAEPAISNRDADANSASKLLQSAKRASQTFKTNLSNSGAEDVSDWARQILQRKSSPNVPTPSLPSGGNGNHPAVSRSENDVLTDLSPTDLESAEQELSGDIQIPAPRITPVEPLPLSISEQDQEDSPHVSAWAKQILKKKSPDESTANSSQAKGSTSSALHRIASTGPTYPVTSKNGVDESETLISEMSTVDVEEVVDVIAEDRHSFDEALQPAAISDENIEASAASDASVIDPASSAKSPTRTLLEGDLVFTDGLTATDDRPGNGSHSADRDLSAFKPETSKPGALQGKMSIQDAIDAQRKETGKFNSKDIEAWGNMLEAKKQSDAAAQKGADSANVLHKLASTSNAAAKIKSTQSNQTAMEGKSADAPNSTGDRRRFEDPVNDRVEPSSKFAKEVEKVLDAAISKNDEHATGAPTKPGEAGKSGRIDANPNFDASRFEQPINRKAETLNPFAREVEKVIDSAIAKGGVRRSGDETGLMKTVMLGKENAEAGSKPAIRKEPRTGAPSSGPDLKKLLSRRKADSSTPNMLDRAQQALKGPAEASSTQPVEQQPLVDEDALSPVQSLDSTHIHDQQSVAEESTIPYDAPSPASESTVDSAPDAGIKPYSRSDLDAIAFGRVTPPAAPEAPPAIALEQDAEPAAKTPLKLDKMRGVDVGKQTQPGFGEKLKSIFGGRKTQNSMQNMPVLDKTLTDAKILPADKGTKSGMPAAEKDANKDKNTKSGMAPAALAKNTRSGMIAPTPDKGTKSGLAAIGAFFGGKKNAAPDLVPERGPLADPKPEVKTPEFEFNPIAEAAPATPVMPAVPTPVVQSLVDDDDDEPVFTSMLDKSPTSAVVEESTIVKGMPTSFTPPAATPQYQNQPASFFFPGKSAEPQDTFESAPEIAPEKPVHKSPGIAEALAALKLSESEEDQAAPTPEAEAAEGGEPNAFARAVAEALAAEEARAKEETEAAQARAEREAAAAARAMNEIVAAEEAKTRAQAEREAGEAAARDKAEQEAYEAAESARAQAAREAQEAQDARAAQAAARVQAEEEAAEAVRAQAAFQAAEYERLFKEQQEIERVEREQADAAARAEREAMAEAQARAEEEERARVASAEQEARERAEAQAAQAASAAAAASAATAAMMKMQQEAEDKRAAEEQAALAQKAAAGAAAEAASREAAMAAASAAAAQEAAARAQSGPQTVDTPSKLSGKASQSQLAQMLNKFAKKSAAPTPDNAGNGLPPAAPMPGASAPMQEVAFAQSTPDMSVSQAPVDDQQVKSQKKFAELAQRLKSNAAKASEAPAVVPVVGNQPAPSSVAMSQQQPFSSQPDFASSYGSNMGSGPSPGPTAFGGNSASVQAAFNANTDFQPSTLPDFDLPNNSAGFVDQRSSDATKEPAQSEAFNKKIEAVKKRIESLKAGVPGAAAAAAGGAVAGAIVGAAVARQEYDSPKVYEDPSKNSMSASSANLGAPPVNRLLEAAQRAVETGSVSRLPAQKSDERLSEEPPQPSSVVKPPAARSSSLPAEAPPLPSASDSIARAVEAENRRKDAAGRGGADAYSSFRDIEASIKSERTKGRDVPDRARVRQSFNKQRGPAPLIILGSIAVVAVVLVFTPVNKMIMPLVTQAQTSIQNMMHPAVQKVETVESTDIDELIQAGKLDRARALLDKSTRANKWTTKDSERHIEMAKKYAESDPPEYEAAIEVLNKIPKKAQFYRKAQKLARGYAGLKKRVSH